MTGLLWLTLHQLVAAFSHIEEVSVYNEASLRIARAPLLITIDYATKQLVIKGSFLPPEKLQIDEYRIPANSPSLPRRLLYELRHPGDARGRGWGGGGVDLIWLSNVFLRLHFAQ